MWNAIVNNLQTPSIIEFGMHQLERNSKGKLWRRHDNRSRFDNLSNALFSDKGAYANCTGTSPYAKKAYSATDRLVVPYAATWQQGEDIAVLIRASVPLPEAVLVPSSTIGQFEPETDSEALEILASSFGEGATSYGIRWLSHNEIVVPVNLR